MKAGLQTALRGAVLGAAAYVAFVLVVNFVLSTNTLQPTPVPLSGVVRGVGFALLVGAAAGATFAYALSRSQVTARAYLAAGVLAGAVFGLVALALLALSGRTPFASAALLFLGSVGLGATWGAFAFLRVRRAPRRYVSRRSL
jgi:hypothetical protein